MSVLYGIEIKIIIILCMTCLIHILYPYLCIVLADQETMSMLQAECPTLAKELIAKYQKRKELPNEEGKTKDGVRLCCSKSQLLESQRQFKIPENLLGRCPTCLENFKNTFCNLACSPGITCQRRYSFLKNITNFSTLPFHCIEMFFIYYSTIQFRQCHETSCWSFKQRDRRQNGKRD